MAVTVTDAQRIRVALVYAHAFVALRYKPKDISLDAYVLDLHRQFPLGKDREAISNEPWRDRALKLEEEVKNLKRKYEEELAELQALRENARIETSGKKKRKLNSARDGWEGSRASLAPSVQNTPGPSVVPRMEVVVPELSGTLGLFNSYNKLFQLSSALPPQSGPPSYSVQLLSSAMNVVQALGKVLQNALSSEGHPKMSSSLVTDFDLILSSTLSCTAAVLHDIESSSSKRARGPTFPNERLDALFSSLSGDIVLPFIKSFARLSEAALVPVLGSTRQQRTSDDSDIPSMKAVLQGLLVILRGVVASVSKLRTPHAQRLLDIMKLAVIAEIERLWTDHSGRTPTPCVPLCPTDPATDPCMLPVTRLSRKERIQLLARKDALWYLCSIARDLFSCSTSIHKPQSPSSDIAREKFDVTLSGILVRCTTSISTPSEMMSRGSFSMSGVEKGMIVSLIESIWLSQ